MKKLLTTISAFALFTALSFADVITISKVDGRFRDNVVIVNKSNQGEVLVKVSIKTTETFIDLENVELAAFDDLQVIKARSFPNKIKSKDITELSIESLNDKTYVSKAYVQRSDLYIEVRDEGSDLRKPAVPYFENQDAGFIDGKFIKGSYDENLKLHNLTNLKRITFKVYVYDRGKKEWTEYGQAQLNGKDDYTGVKKRSRMDLEDCRYFAIESIDGDKYNYSAYADDSDLIINVSF